MQTAFTIIAGVLAAICFLPYINAIVRRKAKPIKATWLIWASLDTITFWGMIVENSMNGQMVATIAGVWIVFFLSLKYGVPGWTRLDIFCLFACLTSILFWKLFDSPVVGIVICAVANCIGSLPTIFSAYTDSRRENKISWVIGAIASCFALASISEWTMAHYIQPASFLLMQSSMLHLLFIRAALPAQEAPVKQEQMA